MCRIQDCEPWDIFRSKHQKARKEHECCECGRTIAKGERYFYAKGLAEKRWDYFHMCAHCDAASKWLSEVCRGYLFYGVLEELEEHFFEEDVPISSIGLGRLVVRMRRKWRNYRDELVEVPTWAEELGHDTFMALREIELIAAFDRQLRRAAA